MSKKETTNHNTDNSHEDGVKLLALANLCILTIEEEDFSCERGSDIDLVGTMSHRQHAHTYHEGKVEHLLNLASLVFLPPVGDLFICLYLNEASTIGGIFVNARAERPDLRCAKLRELLLRCTSFEGISRITRNVLALFHNRSRHLNELLVHIHRAHTMTELLLSQTILKLSFLLCAGLRLIEISLNDAITAP